MVSVLSHDSRKWSPWRLYPCWPSRLQVTPSNQRCREQRRGCSHACHPAHPGRTLGASWNLRAISSRAIFQEPTNLFAGRWKPMPDLGGWKGEKESPKPPSGYDVRRPTRPILTNNMCRRHSPRSNYRPKHLLRQSRQSLRRNRKGLSW